MSRRFFTMVKTYTYTICCISMAIISNEELLIMNDKLTTALKIS